MIRMGLLKGLFKGGRLGAVSDPFSIPVYKDENRQAVSRDRLVQDTQAQHLDAIQSLYDQEMRVCRLLRELVEMRRGDLSVRSREAELMDCFKKIVSAHAQLDATTYWLMALGAVKKRDEDYENLLDDANVLVRRVHAAIGCFVWGAKDYCRNPDIEKLGKRCVEIGGFDPDENFEFRRTAAKSMKN